MREEQDCQIIDGQKKIQKRTINISARNGRDGKETIINEKSTTRRLS
jgi:hypothetical protein